MEENNLDLNTFLSIFKRRKWDFILTATVVFLIIAVATFIWPPTYRSTSMILIEAQEIPREYVMTTVTAYADQRLQTINQRVMSYKTLLDIINRFNLYADQRKKLSTEEIVERMRNKYIKFNTISAEVVDPQTGRPSTATIAFTVSFDGKKPDVVVQVANVLASLYLEENLKSRDKLSSGAAKFIEEETKNIQSKLVELDRKIAIFKQSNIDSLPELSQLNLQTVDRIERDIDQLNDRLRTAKEREGYLQTELASIPPDISNPDKARLKELRAKIVDLETLYSSRYPDVIKTKREIAELERRLEQRTPETMVGGRADNPAYVALASQLAGVQADMESIKRQITEAKNKRDSYRLRIQSGPRVEEAYKLLLSERNNLQLKNDDLMKKLMEARLAQGMEKDQMGERFTLIEAARLPEKPVRPNIPATILIGFILAVGAGVAMASVREYIDQSAHTIEDLARFTNLPVFTGIAEIVTRDDILRNRQRRNTLLVSLSILIVGGLLIIHFFVMDIDIIVDKIMKKLITW